MKKILKKVKYILTLIYHFLFTNKTKLLTLRVLYLSLFFRIKIKFIPMKKLEESFGDRTKESPLEESKEHTRIAFWIGKRVDRVCDKTPWESKCLVKALTVQHLLIEKGIHSTLYMGVRKEEDGLKAHAWLRCGQLAVVGGNGTDHTAVAHFYR